MSKALEKSKVFDKCDIQGYRHCCEGGRRQSEVGYHDNDNVNDCRNRAGLAEDVLILQVVRHCVILKCKVYMQVCNAIVVGLIESQRHSVWSIVIPTQCVICPKMDGVEHVNACYYYQVPGN